MSLSRKKKWLCGSIGTVLLLSVVYMSVVYMSLPYYARQALVHWMPVIDDLETFHRNVVRHNPDDVWHWERAEDYNRYRLLPADSAYLDSLHTISFLVTRHDSILFESYRDGWNDTLTSNLYSATKTIVGLLTGIALDEGKIHSLDDKVSRYIPSYTKGMQADVTVRDLLTMSGGMAWDESYASLFSVTTHGYYGNDLYRLVTGLEVTDRPGVQFSYRSGETQLLAFVFEAATGETLSRYAEEKLWKPMQADAASWKLERGAACVASLYGRDAPSGFLPERPMGKESARLLWFADLDYALPGRGNPLHEGDVRAIHLRYTVGRRDCGTLGAQAA